ncbi:MAG: D-glycero-beta-D-manno-heptose-7-phosphate kinase [Prochloraceae cyanobacterium]|nr:D-glycero-beta-D-manno-heptose-7-phosphate kinase [Prochloraceae cyanobacterium]
MIGKTKEKLVDSADRLFKLIDSMKRSRVLVIGDLTLDEFLTGQVERISREAPVLILRHEYTRQIPGGGANAIYNLAKLGAKVKVAGLLGKDSQGETLRNVLEAAGIDTRGILIERDRPTVTKTRIAGHARQSVTQQIVRVDRKSDQLPHPDLQTQLAEYVQNQLATSDAVVCSDYGDGVLTESVIKAGLSHSRVIVDTQKDLQRFAGATLFTPNIPEAEQAVGYSIKDDFSLDRAGRDLLKLTQAKQILITRGEEGMSLFESKGEEVETSHVPAFNRTDVFDVTGAGDTVVAALTLSLCEGASFWEAAVLGNLAASIVVRQFGTATTTTDEMKEALRVLLED